ncbi:MASE1 domain-containing protein [Myxococcus sp. CA039A]|uniref:sensor histidine kinase n=1 Tax=Myxococcus sp. CA039A TaxID=2741737 RepID=UPI00157A99F9|nr:MASE1 domain-containing protein [Myxococcus sp. CA039A]NTX49850.1 MASE1 domain-containing protein [Myxococcus sp. CA039A]
MALTLGRAAWERAVLLAVSFEVLKVVSSHFVFPPLSSAILWLPAGLTLAFLMRSPTRMWPALLAAVFAAELGSVLSQGLPWGLAATWGLGNVLRTWLGAALMRRLLGGIVRFHRVRDVTGLLVLGAVVGALPSATLGALGATRWLGSASFASEWIVWWLSDALGTVLVAPLLLTWWPVARATSPPRRLVESVFMIAVVALVGVLVFSVEDTTGSAALSTTLPYAAFPLVIAAALRLGPRGAASASAVMSAVAVEYTRLDIGPFGALSVSASERVLSVQVFMSVLSLTALTVAAVVAERRRAEAAQRVLATVGGVLAESPEWSVTLPRVARLLVPELATGVAIWLQNADGVVERVAAAGWTPAREVGLRGRFPPLPAQASDWTGPEGSGVLVPLRVRGQVVGALAVAMDLEGTGRRRREHVLADDVARRCAMALENARLLEEAREAVAVREDFIAVAAHELRTPLATLTLRVQGLMALLRGGTENGFLLERLEAIARQSRRLTRLVENVLDVGLFKAGGLELRREWVDLTALVEDVLERSMEEATRAGTPLRLTATAQRVRGWLDPGRVEQALSNLVSNAIKFGAGGEVDVSLSQVGGRARLVVTDRGIGVPPEAVERIFGPFERAVSTQEYGGLGMGLYLTRRIAEAHGGSVQVSSTRGAGASFVLELPVEPSLPLLNEDPARQPRAGA